LFAHQAYDSFDPHSRPGGLYQLNAADGQAIAIGENGLSISDLAVDSAGRLFGWMEKHHPFESGLPTAALDQLILFDLPSGAPQTFATLGRPGFSSRSGLAFRSNGSLFLKSAPDPSQAGGEFYQIDQRWHRIGHIAGGNLPGNYT
jgi:hypothetical protein